MLSDFAASPAGGCYARNIITGMAEKSIPSGLKKPEVLFSEGRLKTELVGVNFELLIIFTRAFLFSRQPFCNCFVIVQRLFIPDQGISFPA